MKHPRLSFSLLCIFVIGMLLALVILAASDLPTTMPAQIASLSMMILSLLIALEFRVIVKGLGKLASGSKPGNWMRAAAALAILIMITLLMRREEKLLDFSDDGIHQIQAETLAFFKDTKPDFTIVASRKADPEFFITLERFFEILKSALPQSNFQWIDPSTQPEKSRALGVRTLPSVILHMGNNKKILPRSTLFSGHGTQSSFHGEQAIIQGLKSMLNPATMSMVFPGTGRGAVLDRSPNGYAGLYSLLQADGFRVSIENSVSLTSAPMMIFLPGFQMSPSDIENLSLRLEKKLKTILLLEPNPINLLQSITLPAYLKDLQFLGLPVVDPLRNAGSELSFLIPHFGQHPCSKDLDPQFPVLLAGSGAFISTAKNSQIILKSSSISWGEVPRGDGQLPQFDEATEIKGPLDLALGIEDHLLLFADQDFLTNQFLSHPGNQTLILRSLYYLTGNLESSFSKPRVITRRPLNVPEKTRRLWIVCLFILLPLGSFCIGGLIRFARWKNSFSEDHV